MDLRTTSDKRLERLLKEIKKRKSEKYGFSTSELEKKAIKNVEKGLTTTQKDIRRTKLNKSIKNKLAKKKLKKILAGMNKFKGKRLEKEESRADQYEQEIKNRKWVNSQTNNDTADKANRYWLNSKVQDSDEYIKEANRNKKR